MLGKGLSVITIQHSHLLHSHCVSIVTSNLTRLYSVLHNTVLWVRYLHSVFQSLTYLILGGSSLRVTQFPYKEKDPESRVRCFPKLIVVKHCTEKKKASGSRFVLLEHAKGLCHSWHGMNANILQLFPLPETAISQYGEKAPWLLLFLVLSSNAWRYSTMVTGWCLSQLSQEGPHPGTNGSRWRDL